MQKSLLLLDAKNAFLNRILTEEIYINVPHGKRLEWRRGNCCCLKKVPYDLKQAACA